MDHFGARTVQGAELNLLPWLSNTIAALPKHIWAFQISCPIPIDQCGWAVRMHTRSIYFSRKNAVHDNRYHVMTIDTQYMTTIFPCTDSSSCLLNRHVKSTQLLGDLLAVRRCSLDDIGDRSVSHVFPEDLEPQPWLKECLFIMRMCTQTHIHIISHYIHNIHNYTYMNVHFYIESI